jgi:hypothetical protein
MAAAGELRALDTGQSHLSFSKSGIGSISRQCQGPIKAPDTRHHQQLQVTPPICVIMVASSRSNRRTSIFICFIFVHLLPLVVACAGTFSITGTTEGLGGVVALCRHLSGVRTTPPPLV